jgi:hypothetical protein
MKKFSVLILLIAHSFSILFAQDIKQDLLKINNSHSVNEFYAEIDYKYFSGNTLTEETNATHIQSNTNYYFKIKDLEILNNSKCQLMINHFLKTISVMPPGSNNNYQNIAKIPIDSTLKGVKSYSYKKINEKEGKYSISLKKGEYKTIEIYFNSKNYSVSKLKMYVSDFYAAQDPDMAGGILEITYKTFKKTIPSEKRKLLNESSFIKMVKENVHLTSSYKNYELNDYLNIKPE